MKKLNYAVVGLGIGMAHIEGALRREKERGDTKLCAVCDLREDRLSKAAKIAPDAKLYTDYNKMLDNEKIDILSVCVPSGLHAELAVKAASRGINLLVEKPVDITLEAAESIREAAEKFGIKAGVCHQNRKNAVTLAVCKALSDGRFGRLLFGNFEVLWYREQSYYDNGWHGTWNMDGGGSLINQGIHTLDLMRLFMGEPEVKSSVASIMNHNISTEDYTSSLLTFADGKFANLITTTCAYPGITTGISLFGTDGSVILDGDILKLWKFKDNDDEEEMLRIYGGGNFTAANYFPELIAGHTAMVYDIIDAVKENRSPAVPPEEGIRSLELVLKIYKTAIDQQ